MLPNTVEKLAETFARASDWRASDNWGWSHWDSIADGKAHFVDSHTKLNQIFVAQALELLAALPSEQRNTVRLPVSYTLAHMANEGNPQGVFATLKAIEENPGRWHGVLSDNAFQCIGVLRQRLIEVSTAEKKLEEERTRNSHLDRAKLEKFRAELVQYFHDSVRLRPIFRAKGVIELRLEDREGVPSESLSINQIDHKGAFIAQEQVDYAGWGRGYGQGMAQGEDEAVFAAMVNGASTHGAVIPGAAADAIEKAIDDASLKDPIVLQSLVFDARYAEFERNSAFTPKFAPNSLAQWREFDAFMGHLTLAARQIPLFDAFARRKESQNKILIIDAPRFIRWRQYAPSIESGEAADADGMLLIRVVDLNVDVGRRNEIIIQNPPWLAEHSDPVAYLSGSVLVNVDEKFRIEILDGTAGICLTFPGTVEGYEA